MNDRISTGMMFSQSVSLMLGKQSKINHLEQQIATGSKIVSAKDDPVAAGAAVGLDRSLAALERMKLNGNNVQNRLGVQENTLAQVRSGEISLARLDEAVRRILRVKVKTGLFNDSRPVEGHLNELGSPAHRALALSAWMATWWMTQALPLTVDALTH